MSVPSACFETGLLHTDCTMGQCYFKGHLWGLPTNSDCPEFQESLTKRDFFTS